MWVSFDPFRTRGFPDTVNCKPAHFPRELDILRRADAVLFPERWQVNALVFGLGARIFPSHASYLLGYDKIEMTRAFQVLRPDAVPDTLIRPNSDNMADEVWEIMTPPFVAKLPRSSEGRGVWLIESRADWRAYRQRSDVLYVQECLPIDRDIRVVVVGETVIASYWRLQSGDGFHNNVARGGLVDLSGVPTVVTDLVLSLAKTLGVNYAGFDVALVDGRPYVLEFNRLFGNQGIPGGDTTLRDKTLAYLQSQMPTEPDITPPGFSRAA